MTELPTTCKCPGFLCSCHHAQPAGEHHTGTLNLAGQGNPGSSPISEEALTLAAGGMASSPGIYYVPQVSHDPIYDKLARAALEAAYPAIRQQVAEQIAAAIEGCVRDLDQWPGEFYQEAAAKAREIGGVRS